MAKSRKNPRYTDIDGNVDRLLRIVGGVNKDNDEYSHIAMVEIDTGIFALATAPYDYNPESLAYEKKTKPYIHIDDLTVSTGDLEKLLSDSYWQRVKPYSYVSGNVKYVCKNTDIDALESATTWQCWKYTDDDIPEKEGPRIATGGVATEAALNGLSWNI